jgi:3-hydroxyacyl-CoA dehydrogenase
MFGFLDQRLGKGRGAAKDRPNFIANRIGTFGAMVTIKTMLEDGYSIEEVDKITGQAVAGPRALRSARSIWLASTYLRHVIKNLARNLPDDEEREMFVAA